MQQLADRLDEDGKPDDAERWLVRAAEADDHFARFVRTRLLPCVSMKRAGAMRLTPGCAATSTPERPLPRDLGRPARTGGAHRRGGEAEATGSRGGRIPRTAARDRGAQAGREQPRELREPAAWSRQAGDLYAMGTLAEQFERGRPRSRGRPVARRYGQGRESARPPRPSGSACTRHTGTRTANGSGGGSSRLETAPPWRTSRSGNSIRPAPRPPRVSAATASSREELPRCPGRG